MLFCNKKIIAIVAIFFISIVGNLGCKSNVVYANDNEDKNIIILIDKSGSMKNTDKNKLSITAANMILDYVKDDNVNINVVSFGTTTEYYKKINTNPNDDELKDFLGNIKFEDLETNMKSGLEEAISQLNEMQGDKSIVILSDGEDYIQEGITEDYISDFDNLINEAFKDNIKIHTIGLSEKADQEKLKDISLDTGGVYRYALTAENLYDAFISIIGGEENYLTIDNYITEESSKRIQVSSMVDEVIVNIASCDNTVPDVIVKVNGKEISAENSASNREKYRIFRIENNEKSDIEITTRGVSKKSVIVQGRSTAKITTEFNVNSINDSSINIPSKIPVDVMLDIDGIEGNIEGIYFEKYVNSNIEASIDKFNGKVIDNFKSEVKGDYQIKYVAKDAGGGFIASKDVYITVNDEPSYYYGDIKRSLKQGEVFEISVINQESSETLDLNARLIIDGMDDVELVKYGSVLKAQIPTDDLLGDINYRVVINGIYNGNSFGYELPHKILTVVDKPKVLIKYDNLEKKYFKLGEKISLKLIIDEAILYKDEMIYIYDESDNEIGSFNLRIGEKGEILVDIKPLEKASNMLVKFRSGGNVLITEELKTGLYVCSSQGYYYLKFKYIIISITLAMVVSIFLYIVGRNSYRRNIENFEMSESIRYRLSTEVKGRGIDFILNIYERKQYLNYEDKTSSFSFDIIEDNAIGCFDLSFPFANYWKWVQGLMYLMLKDKDFKVKYSMLEAQEITYDGDLLTDNIIFKSGIIIKLNKRKRDISIEFI